MVHGLDAAARGIARHPVRVVVLAALATALALIPASRLAVRADLALLLPEGTPAADAYRQLAARFSGLEKVFVLLRLADGGDDPALLAHAADLLAEALEGRPQVAGVRAGLMARDEAFFFEHVVPNAALLGDLPREAIDARLAPDAVRQRVARLKAALSGPAGSLEGQLARVDPLGFATPLLAAAGSGGLPIDPVTQAFVAPDGRAALVIVTPERAEIDAAAGRTLLTSLESAYADVDASLDADFAFLAVGGPLYAALDERALRADLRTTLGGSIALTSLILIAAFGGLRLPAAVLAPLLIALVWTAGILGLLRGEVAAIAVGFGAVLVGLGIDYGIHTGARFRQASLAGKGPGEALDAVGRHVGPGILTSALTTAAGFAVLGQAHLGPLRELGFLVAVGIVTILAAVVTLGSALLVLVTGPVPDDARRATRAARAGVLWRWLGAGMGGLARFAHRRPWWVLATAAAVTGVALWGIAGLRFDPDLTRLRPADAPVHEAERLLAERFGLGLDTATVVVRGDDLGAVVDRADRAARLVRGSLGGEADVRSPADVLPIGARVQARALELADLPFARAADDLERALVASNFNPAAFAPGLATLRRLDSTSIPPLPPRDVWPDWLAESLVLGSGDVNGSGEAWAAVHVRVPHGAWPDGPPKDLAARLEADVPGTAVASVVALGRELRLLGARDLERLGFLALGAMAVVVLVSFGGRPRWAGLAILPVLLGALWTVGLFAAAGGALDLFSLTVLPIVLGIGIDDGLHVVHGARRIGNAAAPPLLGAALATGRALALTTLTTCAGFASLALSRVPAFRSGGLLIAAGVAACLLATVMILPAIEAVYWRSDRRLPDRGTRRAADS